jgi:signal transduction histidine kinase
MTSEQRHRILLVAAGAALVVILGAGFALVLAQRREFDRTLMEFRALQAVAAITESTVRSGVPDESALPENVLGFGVYDRAGRSLVQIGTAPPGLDPRAATRSSPGSRLDRRQARLRLLRPVGMPLRSGPGHHMDRMPRGMPRHMPRGGPGGGRMPEAAPEGSGGGPLIARAAFLVLDYDVSSLLATTRTRLAYWAAVGVALFGLLATVAVLGRQVRRYEAERNHREQLVQLGEAARTLAHEIRNPLSAIRLQTAVLRRRVDGTSGDEDALPAGTVPPQLDILDEEVGRIDALISQVREFLQDPKGAPETIELGGFLTGLPPRFSFAVRVDLRCECPCPVRFDHHRLYSVLANVIRNAAEAAEATGDAAPTEAEPVELSLERRRDTLVIRVADRGPGLPEPGAPERAFDPFFTRKHGGFGIGLAVSRRFVEAAGGRISLRNRDDAPGAACIIELPEVSPDARAHR